MIRNVDVAVQIDRYTYRLDKGGACGIAVVAYRIVG